MSEGRILRVALDWAVDDIDPPRSFGGWNTGRVVQQTHESLMEDDFDYDGLSGTTRIVPRLARSCDVSPDARRFLFHLRPGVRFHDGAALDAAAVVANYARLWDRASPLFSQVAFDLNRIGTNTISDVRAVDALTVEMRLTDSFPEFLRYMTQEDAPGAQSLISPAALEQFGPDGCGDRAPGTGAFTFHRRFETEGGSAVELRRNEAYWGGPPWLETIQFLPLPDLEDRRRALEEGRVDIAYSLEGTSLTALEEQGFSVPRVAPPYLWYLVFNQREPWMRDRRVRQAIAHAIDRQGLCDTLFPGAALPAHSALPPGSPSHDTNAQDRWPYDPDRARKLLAEAGAPDGLMIGAIAAQAGSAQLDPGAIYSKIATDLAKVGLRLEVSLHPDWVTYCNEWHSGMTEEVAISEMSWGMSCDLWGEQILHSANCSPQGFNTGFHVDPTLDDLLFRARRTLPQDERTSLYRAADRRIMETLPILPIFMSRRGMVAWSSRVTGLSPINQCWHDFRGVQLR